MKKSDEKASTTDNFLDYRQFVVFYWCKGKQNVDLFPDTHRAWHAKFIKQHGDETWLRCASIARQEGNDPRRYFVWLLNRVKHLT